MAGEWRDRFLISSDRGMSHAVFITCGDTLQSAWEIERMGRTLNTTLPEDLRDCFVEGCEQSLQEGGPVAVEGRYNDLDLGEVLFRCIMMPVRAQSTIGEFVYGAYPHKRAD